MPFEDPDAPSVVVERAKRTHVKNKQIETHDDIRHHRLARQKRIIATTEDDDWRDYIDR
jgi:hypothetical protein